MSFLVELAVGDARLGGKARSLAELAAVGLPTPDGFAITDELFRALCREIPVLNRLDEAALARLDQLRDKLGRTPWPAGFCEELRARLDALGADVVAVRSSFADEDRPGQLAAGVYESRLPVPVGEVGPAIRAVLGSALAPGAVAYALAHGSAPVRAPLAVLVHAYVPGGAEGSAAFAPGTMAEPLIVVRQGSLPCTARADLHAALGRLVAARGPTEIEWVLAGEQVRYLQARPFVSPAPAAPWRGWAELEAAAPPQSAWRWDAAHNPLPLSPAQAGLVELVDRECAIGIRQRVLGGYLCYAPAERPLPPAIRCADADAFFTTLRRDVETRLADLGEPPRLEAALALFVHAYQAIFGVLQPALREAQRKLSEFLGTHARAGLALLPALRRSVPSMASERLLRASQISAAASPAARAGAVASYLALFGDEAACWDVATATYAEAPDALHARAPATTPMGSDWQQAAAAVERLLEPGLHGQWRKLLGDSRTAIALGEADDWLYARAQAAVRRALLALGKRLAASGALASVEDVFYLPLPLVRDIASSTLTSPGLAGLAAEGRKSWEAARREPPPLSGASDDKAVRGVGTGGRAIGRVAWHRPGWHEVGAVDVVLVARTFLPTELPLLDAVAIVCETGGPLDHVAAQARERGIPAVVGAQGATAVLTEGDLVLVDGDRGLVVKLG
jgi:phosphohistidine swiveling domain-containing protein